MDLEHRAKFVSSEARKFLLAKLHDQLEGEWKGWIDMTAEDILDLHLAPELSTDVVSLDEVMERLLISAQNRQSSPRVILGLLIEGVSDLRRILGGFGAAQILTRWESPESILAAIEGSGCLRRPIRTEPRSLWPQYCKTILSAAKFLHQFGDADEFRAWLARFRAYPETAAALPLVLSAEIDGFGVALAADFLKELGLVEFGKPDVFTKRLLPKTGLSNAKTDYFVLRDLNLAAEAAGETAYAFDKLLWLIGSGRFYRIVADGCELEIGRCEAEFIATLASIEESEPEPDPADA